MRASGGRACSPLSAWEGGPAGVSEVGAVTLGFPRNLGGLLVPVVYLGSKGQPIHKDPALRLPVSRTGSESIAGERR